jgi:hypothetical protein
LGPVQLQVTGIVLVVFAESESVFPEQTGELDEAVGVAGVSCIVAVTDVAEDVHPLNVAVTLKVPV